MDFPWRYIEDHIVKFIGHLLGTSKRHSWNVILPSGDIVKRTLRRKDQATKLLLYDFINFED